MELKRVVVTGLGALTPIGNNIEEYWEGLVNGKSGAAPVTHFDAIQGLLVESESLTAQYFDELCPPHGDSSAEDAASEASKERETP